MHNKAHTEPGSGTTRHSISIPEFYSEAAKARVHDLRLVKFSRYIQELIRVDQQKGILGPSNPDWSNA